MKGSLHTDELLGAVVARETGLRTGRRLSHVFIMDVPTYHKVLIVTDAAINIAPTLEDKADIVPERDRSRGLAGRGAAEGRDSRRGRDRQLEDAGDARRGRAVQDGRARPDHVGRARRAARLRQRDQQGGGEDEGHHVGGRRRSRHPARAGSRGGQHSRQEPHVPGQRRQRRRRARRARADHPDQPRRQRPRPHRELRGGDAGGARAAAAPRPSAPESRHGCLRPRPERRLVEPEVLRLPQPRGARVAARGARTDRRDRNASRSSRPRTKRESAPPTRRSTRPSATDAPRSTGWPRGSAAVTAARAWSASAIASCTAARRMPVRRG